MIAKMKELWLQVIVVVIATFALEFLFEVLLVLIIPGDEIVPSTLAVFLRLFSIALPVLPAIAMGFWISSRVDRYEQATIPAITLIITAVLLGIVGFIGVQLSSQAVLEYNYMESLFSSPFDISLEEYKYMTLVDILHQSFVNIFVHAGLGFIGGLVSVRMMKK